MKSQDKSSISTWNKLRNRLMDQVANVSGIPQELHHKILASDNLPVVDMSNDPIIKSIKELYKIFENSSTEKSPSPLNPHPIGSISDFSIDHQTYAYDLLKSMGIHLEDGLIPISFTSDADIPTIHDVKVPAPLDASIVLNIALKDTNSGIIKHREYHIYDDSGQKNAILISENVELDPTSSPFLIPTRPDTHDEWIDDFGDFFNHVDSNFGFEFNGLLFQCKCGTAHGISIQPDTIQLANAVANLDEEMYYKYRWPDGFEKKMQQLIASPKVRPEFLTYVNNNFNTGFINEHYDLTPYLL